MRREYGYVLARTMPDGSVQIYRNYARLNNRYTNAIQIFETSEEAEQSALRFVGPNASELRPETAADRGWKAVEAELRIRDE